MNKRLAYFVSHFERDERGFIPCIAVEGERGYNRTDWRWDCDFEMATQLATEANARMGINAKDAVVIGLGTMRNGGVR